LSMAARSRGLKFGSPPPLRAATVISRMSRVKILPRLASCRSLRKRMFAHLEWPAIASPAALRLSLHLGPIILWDSLSPRLARDESGRTQPSPSRMVEAVRLRSRLLVTGGRLGATGKSALLRILCRRAALAHRG